MKKYEGRMKEKMVKMKLEHEAKVTKLEQRMKYFLLTKFKN